jgi:hypothetical protein
MKKNKLPSLVSILILTLLTSVVWVSLSVYWAVKTKPPESVPKAVSEPLTPTLDQDTISKIESGMFLDNSQIPQNITTGSSPLPSPIPEKTPVASSSATP